VQCSLRPADRRPTVNDVNATNLVNVVLQRVHRAVLPDEPVMPEFAHELSDEEIAAVANYVTWCLGGTPSTHSAAIVPQAGGTGRE
jgi:cytochrome c553